MLKVQFLKNYSWIKKKFVYSTDTGHWKTWRKSVQILASGGKHMGMDRNLGFWEPFPAILIRSAGFKVKIYMQVEYCTENMKSDLNLGFQGTFRNDDNKEHRNSSQNLYENRIWEIGANKKRVFLSKFGVDITRRAGIIESKWTVWKFKSAAKTSQMDIGKYIRLI